MGVFGPVPFLAQFWTSLHAVEERNAKDRFGSFLSHYSATSDTISCDDPCGAIGFRSKLFLRYPPLLGLSLDCVRPFLRKEVGVQ